MKKIVILLLIFTISLGGAWAQTKDDVTKNSWEMDHIRLMTEMLKLNTKYRNMGLEVPFPEVEVLEHWKKTHVPEARTKDYDRSYYNGMFNLFFSDDPKQSTPWINQGYYMTNRDDITHLAYVYMTTRAHYNNNPEMKMKSYIYMTGHKSIADKLILLEDEFFKQYDIFFNAYLNNPNKGITE